MPREQFFGIIRDFEKPLLHIFLFNFRIATPTPVARRLLIGQDGLALRTPVNPTFLLVGQSLRVHLKKNPLVPSVVFRKAGIHFPSPIVIKAHSLELMLHVGNIVQSPFLRVDTALYGRIFCRHTKSIPTYGVKNIESLHHLMARNHISNGVIANMPHVDSSRGIGVHFQAVEFCFFRVFINPEGFFVLPNFLPFRLYPLKIIIFRHRFAFFLIYRGYKSA